MDVALHARRMAFQGALLLTLGLLTGGLVAAAMTGKIHADAHAALASHLNALLGAFWIFAVAYTLPFVRLDAAWLKRLAWITVVPQYANWLITAVKSVLQVSGVAMTADPANNAVFVALNLLVVLPSLMGAALWLYGLRPAR